MSADESKPASKLVADALLDLLVWLIAYAGALIAVAFALKIIVGLYWLPGQLADGEFDFSWLYPHVFVSGIIDAALVIGALAFLPAAFVGILCRVLKYEPPLFLIMLFGSFLGVIVAFMLTGYFYLKSEIWVTTAIYVASGAIGGLSFTLFRRSLIWLRELDQ